MTVVYKNTTSIFEMNTELLDIGLVKYILNVPFEYSPEIISDGMIVDKNGICVIRIAIIRYVDKYPFTIEPIKIKESCICPYILF